MFNFLPENVSTFGGDIDHVMWVITVIVGVWFIMAEGLLLYFAVRYRSRNGGRASHSTGTTGRALAWILVPAVLVLLCDLVIDLAQNPVWAAIKMTLPGTVDETIRIEGEQFAWNFVHAGSDRTFGTKDDIKTLNHMSVPVDSKIVFELGAKDVLHSLWIPHLRLKQDAVPGRTIKGWFEATKPGDYPIACAELCGGGHGTMKGRLHVLTKEDFQKWVTERSKEAESTTIDPFFE